MGIIFSKDILKLFSCFFHKYFHYKTETPTPKPSASKLNPGIIIACVFGGIGFLCAVYLTIRKCRKLVFFIFLTYILVKCVSLPKKTLILIDCFRISYYLRLYMWSVLYVANQNSLCLKYLTSFLNIISKCISKRLICLFFLSF